MKKLTKTELINALCAVQLEHAKKRSAELKNELDHNKLDITTRISDYLIDHCKTSISLWDFIDSNFDSLVCCKYTNFALQDSIGKRRTLASEYAYTKSQIERPTLIKKRVDYLRDPTMTVTIEDGQTIYENETLEAERKRIFGD